MKPEFTHSQKLARMVSARQNKSESVSIQWRLHCAVLMLFIVLGAVTSFPAVAVIVYTGASSGANNALPTDTTAGALVIVKPAGTVAGEALIATIAARPSGMVVTVPANWYVMTVSQQLNGGPSTLPGGMTMLTYYHIVGTSEPASYTWTFANKAGSGASYGGSAVGGILAFSGIDTSGAPGGNPIDVWSALNVNAAPHTTTAITPTVTNTMIVSSISYLSGSSFANPTSNAGCITNGGGATERLDQRAPAAVADIGTTIQMSTAPCATANATTGAVTSVIQPVGGVGADDSGVGHLMALKPSVLDLSILMTRSVPLSPGGTASYSMSVTNNGSIAEPGPISVVDTLPAGLSYASVSGAGWGCSVAGQVVTCTRTPNALAAGVTATALVLNVNVSAGASGVLTNTATVSGTGGDGNTANNTATDTYVIPSPPNIYYAMDDVSWVTGGNVTNSGTSGSVGTVLGTATATGGAPPNPPDSALTGNPGTCGMGKIPGGTTAIGVSTNTDVNTLGNAGTIAFWYSSNTVWNDGNSRLLFDASNELGTAAQDKHFFLAKDGAGRLVFALEDSADTDSTAQSVSYNYAANTWHHIAVSWDIPNNSLKVFLDGDPTPVATSVTVLNGTLGDMATLYLGAQRFTTIAGTPAAYTNNTLNGYIDEARIYNRVLDPLEIQAVASLRHACATTVDHYELSVPTSSITCLPTTVKVTACADSSSPCINPQAAVVSKTATLSTSAGTLGATSVSFDATGVANTTLSYPAAANGAAASVTLSGEQTVATNSRKCCPDGINCVVANSCSSTFNTAGFIFSSAADGIAATIPAQVSGISSSTYYLRAVKTNTTTKACESALNGANTVNFAYECSNPATCYAADLMSVNGGTATTIARNNSGSHASVTSVNMTFDANGNAPFTFNYSDVGQVTLWVNKTVNSATLTGPSNALNAFVVAPHHFGFSGVTAGPIKAGNNFSATLSAYNGAASPTVTPSFGREATPESVTLSFSKCQPTGTNSTSGAFSGNVGIFTNGVASASNLNWTEVGNIDLIATLTSNSYLLSGLTATGNTGTGGAACTGGVAGNVGRFIPDHFDTIVTGPMACPTGLTCPVGGSVYSGQAFTANVYARNATGVATQNYDGTANTTPNFAKAVTLTAWAGVGNTTTQNPPAATPGSITGGGAIAASSFSMGATVSPGTPGAPIYTFGTVPTSPTDIYMRAADTDGVTTLQVPANTSVEGGVKVVSGRFKISNAYGSELLPLAMTTTAQYWNGTNWLTSSTDNTSSFNSNRTTSGGNLVAAIVSGLGGGVAVSGPSTAPVVSGVRTFRLSAPGVPGSANISLNAPSYLPSTSGLATFGVYSKGTNEFIYMREAY